MAEIIGAKQLAFNPKMLQRTINLNLTDNMNRQASAMDLAYKKRKGSKDQQAQRQALQQNVDPKIWAIESASSYCSTCATEPISGKGFRKNAQSIWH